MIVDVWSSLWCKFVIKMNPMTTTKVTLFCSKKMSCWCLYFLKIFSNIILHYITTFTDIKCVYISTFPAYISNWMFTNHMAFLHTYLLGFLDVCSTIICRAMCSLIQKKLWYKVRNQVHFEWYFRWCLGIPKHIETPTIFRNIFFHEFPLNMEYPWDIHGVSAFLISRFSRSGQHTHI